jgi:hypothetical protein
VGIEVVRQHQGRLEDASRGRQRRQLNSGRRRGALGLIGQLAEHLAVGDLDHGRASGLLQLGLVVDQHWAVVGAGRGVHRRSPGQPLRRAARQGNFVEGLLR